MPPPSVVVGAVSPLAALVPDLRLQDLVAVVLDDATAFLQDQALHRSLEAIMDRCMARARNWGKFYIHAVTYRVYENLKFPITGSSHSLMAIYSLL